MSDSFLRLYQLLWRGTRPLLFRSSPQQAHDQALALWRRLDEFRAGNRPAARHAARGFRV